MEGVSPTRGDDEEELVKEEEDPFTVDTQPSSSAVTASQSSASQCDTSDADYSPAGLLSEHP
eukprot:6234771-Alexandrium_andersonii.AAC.2